MVTGQDTSRAAILRAALELIVEDADALSQQEIREIAQEALDKYRSAE